MIKDYFQMPVNSTWISVGYNSKHTALDMGWTYEAGRNQPVYPIAKGIVVDKGWYEDGGNFIWTKHEDVENTWFAGYMHLHNRSPLKVGARVNRKTQLGKMGMTGRATGQHVHFVLVKAPKGTKWSNSGTRKYRVNPAKYLYRFPHQTVKNGAAKIKSKPKALYSPSSGKKYINIHKGKKYGTYSLNVQPVSKNIDKWLRPDKFGGMSYEIIGNTKYKDVFLIETKDFGKRQVYLDTTRASITDEPMYKVRGGNKVSKPSKPKYNKVTAKVVNDVLKGKYGNGATRKKNLEKAGYNYKEVQDAVNRSAGAKPKAPSIKKGSKVRVKSSAKKYATGQAIPNWVKNRTFTVQEKGTKKVLLKEISSWVNLSDVKKV